MVSAFTFAAWAVYGIVVAFLIAIASGIIHFFQSRRERSRFVIYVCIFTLLCLLATVLLVPADVALVSSTAIRASRGETGSIEELNETIFNLKMAYGVLYTVDGMLCFVIIPLAYFWYDEYDEVAWEEGRQTQARRVWSAFKSTANLIFLMAIIMVAGFALELSFVQHRQLPDFLTFWKLLTEDHGERFFLFVMSIFITLGTLIYIVYTSTGLALLPVSLLKSVISSSRPEVAAATAAQLEYVTLRQHQLNMKCRGNLRALSSAERSDLARHAQEEKTLRRRLRLMEAEHVQEQELSVMARMKLCALLEPLRGLVGFSLLLSSLLIFFSILLTTIDRAKDIVCGTSCFSLRDIHIMNPLNLVLRQAAKAFPTDLVIFTLLTAFLFAASVVGLVSVGLRFLWIRLFTVRRGRTSPQALLMATGLLTLIALALNYAMPMVIAPQYATYGSQKFCSHPSSSTGRLADCDGDRKSYLKTCTHHVEKDFPTGVCTPSVASTFLTKIVNDIPMFGTINLWCQLAFLAIFLTVLLISSLRPRHVDVNQLDEDAEEAEEEALFASSNGRSIGRAWNDLINRPTGIPGSIYGTTARS